MLPRSRVRSEHTQAISGHPGLQPDILSTAPDRAPVVVEAEYMPAHTVEADAKVRLGLEVASNGRPIDAVIALRYPEELREAHDLHSELSSAASPTASSQRAPRTCTAFRSPAGWTATLRTWRTRSG